MASTGLTSGSLSTRARRTAHAKIAVRQVGTLPGFRSADAAAGVARLFYEASQRDGWEVPWEFGAASDDEPDAYRNSAASDQGYTVLFFVDAYGVIKAGVPRGLNFSLKAAVEQYCCKPALVVVFLRRFLWVPVHHYVDDF